MQHRRPLRRRPPLQVHSEVGSVLSWPVREMKRTRRALFLVVLFLLAVTVAWWHRPRWPYEATFEQVRLGERAADVVARFEALPKTPPVRERVEVELWKGHFDGRPEEIQIDDPYRVHPVHDKSLQLRWTREHHQGRAPTEQDADGWFIFRHKDTGEVLGRRKKWESGPERVLALFDADGKLVELLYHRIYWPWWKEMAKRLF